jgi:hypothetical protein
MRIGIIGSREFNDYELVKSVMSDYQNVEVIVSGGARGADTLGERWASENGVKTLIFKPDWDKYGKSAGFIRNKDIVRNSDLIIAFWDGQSKGTKSSIDLCENYKVKVKVIKYE